MNRCEINYVCDVHSVSRIVLYTGFEFGLVSMQLETLLMKMKIK